MDERPTSPEDEALAFDLATEFRKRGLPLYVALSHWAKRPWRPYTTTIRSAMRRAYGR